MWKIKFSIKHVENIFFLKFNRRKIFCMFYFEIHLKLKQTECMANNI